MTDVLYEFENQFREKRAIWRLFEIAPFKYALARGRIFRWFGINIPLHLIGRQGDLDLILSLKGLPQQKFMQLYETWEVKTTLIAMSGQIRSSKSSAAKQNQLLGQMRKYRQTGSPCHGLFELFIYEDGTMESFKGPPREVLRLMGQRLELLGPERFGYRVMHFEHDREHEAGSVPDNYLGVKVNLFPWSPADPAPVLIEPATTDAANPFAILAHHLEDFVAGEIAQKRITYGDCVVTFCHDCKQLLALSPKGIYKCRHCSADLTLQLC